MNSPARFAFPDSPGPVADIATILVPIDCGPRSRALLRSASALARRVGGHLVILHVYEPITYAPAHYTVEQLNHCQEFRQHDAQERLELFQDEFLDDPEVQSATLLALGGFPEEEICKIARRMDADLIVASTHGYRGLNRLFIGSMAERLIRRVPCPILILPTSVEGSDEENDVIELHHKSPAFEENRRSAP
jgi:nucleotide-binding universal stress UspA family protein